MNTMTDRDDPAVHRRANHRSQAIAALSSLEAEDSQMRTHLLDAAVAGAILARDPADRSLRREAAREWKSLAATLLHHVTTEEAVTSLKVGLKRQLPRPLVKEVRERLGRLRALTLTVEGVDFEHADDAQVRRGARALCAIAVDLDDLIDSDERHLFPLMQRALFGHPERK